MEYTSPLGYNFRLKESLASQNDKKNESDRKSLPNFLSPDSEKSRMQFSYEGARKAVKRNSHFDRSPGFGSDQKNKWNSPGQRNWRKNRNSVSISDYYHPSMVDNPWKELEKELLKTDEKQLQNETKEKT